MCWMCDHPGATLQDYLDQLRSLAMTHGWAVQAVQRDRLHPPFAYTVGLTAWGKPELVVTGMPTARAGALLNEVAAHVLHADVPEPGEQVPLIGGPLIEFVEVQTPSAHLLRACDLYGTGIRALQIVHADDRGHWPWETGYRGVRGGQPVLGLRANTSKAG
jgi:hypothetical protein